MGVHKEDNEMSVYSICYEACDTRDYKVLETWNNLFSARMYYDNLQRHSIKQPKLGIKTSNYGHVKLIRFTDNGMKVLSWYVMRNDA